MIAHALITGAAGAIGSSLARALRRRAPSLRLSLVDRDAAGLDRARRDLGGDVACFEWDLADLDALPSRFEELCAGRGDPDALVNNAGVMELRSLAATPWEAASRLLRIDLESPLRLLALVAPRLVSRRAGLIVNVTSMAGVTPLRGGAYYGAAKAGLGMASEVAHLELAPHGVHVVTVYPGPVRSALEQRARAQLPATWLTRLLPTGKPDVLAEKIAVAIERRHARVVYPPLYDLANRVAPLAGAVTRAFSPAPLDAP